MLNSTYYYNKHSLRRQRHIGEHVQKQPQAILAAGDQLAGAPSLYLSVFLLSFRVLLALAGHVLQESA